MPTFAARLTSARPTRGAARALLPLALVVVAGCSSSEGQFSVCGIAGSITAPVAPSAALEPVLRFHGTITPDSAWRERVVQELGPVRADSVVRLLFVHQSSIVAADRDRVTAGGGTIVEEPAEWNGIVATFTVAGARAYVPGLSLARVIDGHLVTERVLPPCD
jgi:hypothetical protein